MPLWQDQSGLNNHETLGKFGHLMDRGKRPSSQNPSGAAIMIRVDEVRKSKGQIQFALAALGANSLQVKAQKAAMTSTGEARQLSLSADRVLLGLAAAVGFMGIFLWALIRLWLFEP